MAIQSGFSQADLARMGPDELTKRRLLAEAMLAKATGQRKIEHPMQGMAQMAEALMGGLESRRLDNAETAGREGANSLMSRIAQSLTGGGGGNGAVAAETNGGAAGTPVVTAEPGRRHVGGAGSSAQSFADSPTNQLAALIDAKEGAGDYTTLYGHAQRGGGALAGTDITKMTIGDLKKFASADGVYGRHQRGKLGYLATPMGRYQIVGSTLAKTAEALGIPDDTPFTPEVQDAMFNHLAKSRLAGGGDKLAALRSEWEGFKHVPDAQLAAAIKSYESGSGELGGYTAPPATNVAAAPAQPQGVQVASLDPSAGVAQALVGDGPALTPEQQMAVQPQLTPDTSMTAYADPQDARGAAVFRNPVAMPPTSGGVITGKNITPQVDPWAGQREAAPQQQAQAQALIGPQGSAQPQKQQVAQALIGQGGVGIPELFEAAQDPWLNPAQLSLVEGLLQQKLQEADPLRQLQIEKARKDLAAPPKQWQKLDDDTLFDPASGEIKEIGSTGGAKPMFEGKSVEAQALNAMVESGRITPEQAQDLAAGKVITNPADGSMIFMTPQGLVGAPAGGGQPQPIQPAAGAQPAAPSALTSPEPLSGNGAVPAGVPGARTLTPGKPGKLATEAETRARALYTVAAPDLKRVEDNFPALQDMYSQVGDLVAGTVGADSFFTSPEYQRASNALSNVVQTYMYVTSGASAPDTEVKRNVKNLTPRIGESKESVADKLDRVKTMVTAIRQAGGNWSPPDPLVFDGGQTAQPGPQSAPASIDDLIKKYDR